MPRLTDKEKRMLRFSVHLEHGLVQQLAELANKNERSTAAEIRLALKAHVAALKAAA